MCIDKIRNWFFIKKQNKKLEKEIKEVKDNNEEIIIEFNELQDKFEALTSISLILSKELKYLWDLRCGNESLHNGAFSMIEWYGITNKVSNNLQTFINFLENKENLKNENVEDVEWMLDLIKEFDYKL